MIAGEDRGAAPAPDVVVVDDPPAVGAFGAQQVAALVRSHPDAVLGVATGSSPLPIYRALATMRIRFTEVWAFALDEYLGLHRGHPESYAEVLRHDFAEPLGLLLEQLQVPDGTASDPDVEAQRYEQAIRRRGGVDLQLLGIGRNGHIGFNEPGSAMDSPTRVVELSETTRRDNARFFGDEEVPRRSITQGLGTILRARRLLLVAMGEAKAEAVANMLRGPVTAACPASVIQRHPYATVVVDEEAASLLDGYPTRRVREPAPRLPGAGPAPNFPSR